MEQSLNIDRSISSSDDVTGSRSTPSSTTDDGHKTNSSTSESSFSLAWAETRAVNRSKVIVYAIIAVAAAALGCVTYIFVRNDEQDMFQEEFSNHATEVIDLAHLEARTILSTIDEMATTITAFSDALNYSWPFITVRHFELLGEKFNEITRSLQISLVPVVSKEDVREWQSYAFENQGWLDEVDEITGQYQNRSGIPVEIHSYSNETHDSEYLNTSSLGKAAVVWQQSPAPSYDPSVVNLDLLTIPLFLHSYLSLLSHHDAVFSKVADLSFLYSGALEKATNDPESFIMYPIYPSFAAKSTTYSSNTTTLAAFLVVVIPWQRYFTQILSSSVGEIVVVVSNTCGDVFTYRLDGPIALFMGLGDLHDKRYTQMCVQSEFASHLYKKDVGMQASGLCEYQLKLYPTSDLEVQYTSNNPALFTSVVVFVFFSTAAVFFIYDLLVQRRQRKVVATARRTNAIVTSLFPSTVRDRILMEAEAQEEDLNNGKQQRRKPFVPKAQLKDFLDEEKGHDGGVFKTKPIADLFPMATVMFADISGFTAWSSVREPSQVFTLLESVYHSFDEIAKRRRVFKVETVGDCYVAVCGLPDPRKDHAVVMSRFARDCLQKMNTLTKQLEESLGPDTGDLSLRIGVHSGPVTAGVLRGEKSRFQLFGDTVNTTARIESTGERNRIHISEETAKILISSGKRHWVQERRDLVHAKGKGKILTYWLELKPQSSGSVKSHGTNTSDENGSSNYGGEDEDIHVATLKKKWDQVEPVVDDKYQRLVHWNTDVLCRLLKQIEARRQAKGKSLCPITDEELGRMSFSTRPGQTVLDEVKEIIHLPSYDANAVSNEEDPNSIALGESVTYQLREYVSIISSMYRDNPFHNFEHASHVTMSVVKLLSRIVAPDVVLEHDVADDVGAVLHDHTYGITSDPLTQFACVFAALIHDVDHTGLPNAILIKEKSPLAAVYKNKSVAEQNSVDVAWNLLMDDCFKDLRNIICPDVAEMKRFRQLVVNCVMATDIVDKELKALRNGRWDQAFKEKKTIDESPSDTVNRIATIVIEHLIQASDVAHTMQHWHIYRKWNERFFHETYRAYKESRIEQDPSETWYHGEIGFFDFYIIPLAKKLKECGVFGVSSDEYLNYAEKNRSEWENRGQIIVEAMKTKYEEMYKAEVGVAVAAPCTPFPNEAPPIPCEADIDHSKENGGTN